MQREPLHSDHSTVRVACALSRSFLNILVLFDSWIIHHNNSSLLIRNNISWMRHVVSIHVFQHPFLTYFFPDHMCHPPNFFPVTGNILKLLPSICTAKDTYFSACPGVASVLKNQTRGSTAESCFMWQWTWVLAMVVVFVCGYIHYFKKKWLMLIQSTLETMKTYLEESHFWGLLSNGVLIFFVSSCIKYSLCRSWTWDLAWHDVLNMFRVHGSSHQPTPKLVTHLSLKRSVIRCQRLRANFLILDTESNDHMDQSVELLSASDFFPTSKSPLRNCYFFTVFYAPKKQPSRNLPQQKTHPTGHRRNRPRIDRLWPQHWTWTLKPRPLYSGGLFHYPMMPC